MVPLYGASARAGTVSSEVFLLRGRSRLPGSRSIRIPSRREGEVPCFLRKTADQDMDIGTTISTINSSFEAAILNHVEATKAAGTCAVFAGPPGVKTIDTLEQVEELWRGDS